MQPTPTEQRPASASRGPPYFFSIWPYEDRAFLRGVYKRFACTKVHLMVQIKKASPGPPWDCSHWRMWQNMAREVRSTLRWQVTPKKMEEFFWEVIAEGTGHYEVTERLDALIFGDGVSPAEESKALGKCAATEYESTSAEEHYEGESDYTCEDDEVVDDDDDADFTVGRAKVARIVSKRAKRARKCAKLRAVPGDAQRARKSAGETTVPGELVAGCDSNVGFILQSAPSGLCSLNYAEGDNCEGSAFARRQLSACDRDAGSGGGYREEDDDTGVYGERIPRCSAQTCVAGDETSPAPVRDRPTPAESERPSSVCGSANGTADVATSGSQLPRISDSASRDDDDLPLCCLAKKPRFSVSTEPYVGEDEPKAMLDDDLRGSDIAVGTVSPGAPIQLPDSEVNLATAKCVDQEVLCKPTCVDVAVQCELDSTHIAEMMHREHLLRMEVLRHHRDALTKRLDAGNM